MALTTLFGTTQLALQDALARELDTRGPMPSVPNFVIVSIMRDRFLADNPGALDEERNRFRHDLEKGARSFLTANGWRVGGSGTFVLNVLVRTIDDDCTVQVRTLDRLYDLEIDDDSGTRTVAVKNLHATIGREHDSHSRGFVPVNDRARLFSREHIALVYQDLVLTCRLLGQNPTTLNGAALGPEQVQVHDGDTIRCGEVGIVIRGLM